MRKVNILFCISFVSFCASIADSRVSSTVVISSTYNLKIPPKDDDEKSVKTLKEELKQDNDDYIETTHISDLPYFPRFTGKTWKPIQFTSEAHENYTLKLPTINDKNLIIDNDQKFRRKGVASHVKDSDVSGDEIINDSLNSEKILPAVQSKQNSRLITKLPQQPLKEKGNFITPNIKPMKPSMEPHWLHSSKKAKHYTQVLRSKVISAVKNDKEDFEQGEQVQRAIDTADLDKFASVFSDDMSYISASRERIVPDEGQLDMAVAKGSRVELKRRKHQLCDRNILLPEGPKYDSKGKVYLAEFEGNINKTFPHTRRPILVLPKCCNCCRKSVLGCQ